MKKINSHNQSEIFERVVRDGSGRFFRVRFIVVERDSVLRGKVISCQEIVSFSPVKDESLRIKDFRYCLPVRHSLKSVVKDKGLRIKDFYASPYFNIFELLTPIKIRAPSR